MAFEERGNYLDKVPYTFTVIQKMQQQTIKTHPIVCLFDLGSDVTWIHQRAIPRHITITTSSDLINGITMARTFTSNKHSNTTWLTLARIISYADYTTAASMSNAVKMLI